MSGDIQTVGGGVGSGQAGVFSSITVTGKTSAGTAITTAQNLGVPYLLGMSGIPLIGLSTTTITAGGAMTVGTALPATYANCYVYLAANVAASTSPAGFYYAQMSSSTAGTLFNNQLTTWPPTIPGAPTSCTTASNLTGDTGEEFLPGITVPADAMGANGAIRVTAQALWNNSGGTKFGRVRFSGNSGGIYQNTSGTTTTGALIKSFIQNTGVTNAQSGYGEWMNSSGGMGPTMNASSSADTHAGATTVVFSLQRNTATDNALWINIYVELLSTGT